MEEKFCCNRKSPKAQISEIEGDKSFDIIKCGRQIVTELHSRYQDEHKEQVCMKLYLYFSMKIESYRFNYMLSFAVLEATDFSRTVKSMIQYIADLFRLVFLEIGSWVQNQGNENKEMYVDLRTRWNNLKLLQGNFELNWETVCLQRL